MKAKAIYSVKKWEEQTYDEIPETKKLTKASVEYSFSGEIVGKASVEYLMFYSHVDLQDQHKSAASYVGLMRFEGTLNGRAGSFVTEDHGAFRGGAATSDLLIAEGSGTGALAGITGKGSYRADRDGARLELNYDLV